MRLRNNRVKLLGQAKQRPYSIENSRSLNMADFSAAITASNGAWTNAQAALDVINNMSEADKKDPTKFSEALLKAQLQISIATSVEQKASSAIDKAYQAHGQVASK
jgi:hypothetical protein